MKPVSAEEMYKCQICGNTSQPRTPAYKITTETRSVSYPARSKVNACWKRVIVKGEPRSKFIRTDDKGGIGFECAREVIACPDCVAKLTVEIDKSIYQSVNGDQPASTKRKRRG
jgi:hypothetical protein